MSVFSAGFELNNRRRRGASGAPTMLLNLLNSSSLDQRVTFSRGTNAMMTDSAGNLTYAPSNLIVNSENFKFPGFNWVAFGTVSTVSNATVAPNGTTTADSITFAASSGIYQNRAVVVGVNYSISIWLRADTPSTVRLASNTDTSVVVSTSCSVTTEWKRFSLVRICPVGATTISLQLDQAAGVTVYAWGAQLGAVTYETEPRTYNSTMPKNLLGRTEELTTAPSWTNAAVVSTVNATLDPNGFLTAEKFAATSGASVEHYVRQTVSIPTGTTFTASVYVKAAGLTTFRIRCLDSAIPANGFGGTVDTSTGATAFFTAAAGTVVQVSAINVGNDWYRLTVTGNAGPTCTSIIYDIFIMQAGLFSGTQFTGNDVDGGYFWGAQVSDSASVEPYVYNPVGAPTSTAYYGARFEYDPAFTYSTNNLIPYAYPQDFASVNWSKPRASAVLTTATADPSGSLSAYKLIEDNTPASTHLIAFQGANTAVTTGVQYTMSGYVKAAERTQVAISLGVDNGAFLTTHGGNLNLITGVVTGAVGNGITAVNVGNDWWRWAITATAAASVLFINRISLMSSGISSYNGDGVSGVYIWGAQLTTSAAAVPFYYYSRTPNSLGLLIEEARTNLMFPSDANAGWTASSGLIVATANADTSPDGTINATKLTTGDTVSGSHIWYKIYTGAINTTYCASVYFKAGEYTRAQIAFDNTSFAVTTGALFDLANGTVVATGGGSTATITPVDSGWYRCSVTATSVGVAGNYVVSLSPVPASVTTFNSFYTPASTGLGVYVYGAQVEAAAFATSHIPTVGAAVTRSADIATMIGNNFTNWYNQTTGTLSVAFDTSPSTNASYVSASNGNIAQNSVHIDNDITSGFMRAVYYSATVAVATLNLGATGTVGTTNKIATAYAVNDFAASRNGGTVATGTGALPIALTQLNIGTDDRLVSPYYTNGHIKTIAYYNTRLTNTQLQAIST